MEKKEKREPYLVIVGDLSYVVTDKKACAKLVGICVATLSRRFIAGDVVRTYLGDVYRNPIRIKSGRMSIR